AERAELDHGQESASEGPTRRGPGSEHPVTERAHGRHCKYHASPRVAKYCPAHSHHEPLADRINRAVRQLLKHELRFEKLMQRMRRICETEVPQRIGHEQMTEFVIDIRRRNGMMR